MHKRVFHFVLALALLISFSLATDTSSDTNDTQAKKHRKEQTRPIKLGTSGGNNKDTNGFFCCSGTLGALVEDIGGTTIRQYILSNNHVLGLSNKGKAGDDVDQPGLIDHNCIPSNGGPVADLSRKVKFKFGTSRKNLVDAAIAQVRPGAVDPSGAILDIGIPGQPVEPALGDKVQKTGRTTGKRAGEVIALGVTFLVPIPEACGSGSSKLARFDDQIVIEPVKRAKPFVQGGDSGSLVVAKTASCPAAVGLVAFGDDQGVGGANRIQNVLSKLKVKIVGCPAAASASRNVIRPLSMQDPRMMEAKAVKERYLDRLLRTPGVSAVGIGRADQNSEQLALIVYVVKGSIAASKGGLVPSYVGNLPVRIKETSGFRLM